MGVGRQVGCDVFVGEHFGMVVGRQGVVMYLLGSCFVHFFFLPFLSLCCLMRDDEFGRKDG